MVLKTAYHAMGGFSLQINTVDLALCQSGMVLFHTHFTRCRGESGTAAELGLAREKGSGGKEQL